MAPCLKKKYSKADALYMKNFLHKKTRARDIPRRIYPCPQCRAWHLTSKK